MPTPRKTRIRRRALDLRRVARGERVHPGERRGLPRVQEVVVAAARGRAARKVVAVVGRIAFLSRATKLAIVGYFLASAAIDRAPREARGPAGAVHAIWEQPHGDILLAMMAGGLLAFGAYALLEARWRRLFNG